MNDFQAHGLRSMGLFLLSAAGFKMTHPSAVGGLGRLSVKAHGLRSMELLELATDEHGKELLSIDQPMVILSCFRV